MKHELLAPAGNIEAGYAALFYGADAVYLGLTKFSARAGAENFTPDELDEFTAYAHSRGAKVFVALNTILTENEIDELTLTFSALKKAKVDALIIQDLGVFYLAKKLLPEIELHASTQMAVHNAEGAKFLQSIGFKRVVLARELSLQEIKAIAAACPNLDLEVFVHGALCYSYSGQCLFSALEYGKSANRGRCVYPCRALFGKSDASKSVLNCGLIRDWKPVPKCSCTSDVHSALGQDNRSYSAINPTFEEREETLGKREETLGKWEEPAKGDVSKSCGKRVHLFSMKDLALEEAVLKIPALSLKIEGRKKSPLYVAAVTNYYRHILDGKKKDLNEAEDIKQIFSRPWCRFHFNGKDKNVTDENFVGHRGLLIGSVERINKGRLGFKSTHNIARYDGIQIDSGQDEKPFGFGIKALFVNNKSVVEAKAGQYVELELPEEHPHLALHSPVYLASSSYVKGKYDYTKPKPNAYRNLTPLDVRVEVRHEAVWAMCAEVAVSVYGTFDKANDIKKVEEAIKTAFAKTGGTPFEVKSLDIYNPEGLFVPMSLLNELRRELLEKMPVAAYEIILPTKTKNTLRAEAPIALKFIRVNFDTKVELIQDLSDVWFVLPQICRNIPKLKAVIDKLYAMGARWFVAENYYVFEMMKKYPDIKLGAGSFVYVMNSFAVRALKEFGACFATLALESSEENMKQVVEFAALPLAQVTKAYPPLFTSAVCIRPNACKDCKKGVQVFNLKKDGKDYMAISRDCQIQLFSETPYQRALIDGVQFAVEEK